MLTKNIEKMKAEAAAHIAADAVVGKDYWTPSDNDVGGTGCFIGCLTHGSRAVGVTDRFGMPEPLVKIVEDIFERLPEGEQPKFFGEIPAAIDVDGRDLSKVHWQFLAEELRELPAVPPRIQAVIDPVVEGIKLLAVGKDWPISSALAAAGAAARAAAYATRAAAYAADAARAAACAARAAADAARAAAYAARAAAYAADAAARAAAYAARAAAYAADADRAAAYAADAARAARDAAYAADAARAADAANRQRQTILRLISEAPVVEKAA